MPREAADLLVYHAAQAIRLARPGTDVSQLNKRELDAFWLGVRSAAEAVLIAEWEEEDGMDAMFDAIAVREQSDG